MAKVKRSKADKRRWYLSLIVKQQKLEKADIRKCYFLGDIARFVPVK